LGTFWHHGEVVRTLAETLPYLDSPLQVQLAAYLKREVETYLLDPAYYEPRSACLDFDTDTLQDPCARTVRPRQSGCGTTPAWSTNGSTHCTSTPP
ncbi:MAG: hypothetical protein M5R40_22540, partial [Anaerolineae bacterium]|nr:hypothetical protein [Anaerolineae bacterium]